MTPRLPGRAGAITLAAATLIILAGCGSVGGKLTFHDTEKVKITDIVLNGHGGDVIVRTAAIAETRITRTIRDTGDPEQSYRIDGTTLLLDSRCGPHCNTSYEVEAPAGVNVRGKLTSGTVSLTDVGTTDVTLTSGDVLVQGATGLVKVTATSGDVQVNNAKGGATLWVTSGNVNAIDISGPVDAKLASGDLTVQMTTAAPVTAKVGSGDLRLRVPAGGYQIRRQQGSGDTELNGITNDPAAKTVLDLKVDSGDMTVDRV
jgi:hypothetical protein